MRVLLTHERFLPDFAGGGEHLVAGTAKHLLNAGVAVRVLTTGDPKLVSYEGVPTLRLPVHRYRFNLAVRRIEDLARDHDLIQTFNYHACLPSFLAARRLGKPIVCLALAVFGRTWLEMKGQLVGRAAALWERYVLTRPYDRLVLLTEHNRELAVGFGASTARSLIIDPAVDVHEYGPAPEKEDVVLFSAKLEARKGVEELLDVARALPDVRFQVLGWGPDEDKLRRCALPNLEFAGFEQGERFRQRFARARIFFLPSRAEGFPLVLLYAMASGCAVIGTLPLPFEGVHIPVGDTGIMVDAVRRLWMNRNETDRMGEANRQRAQQYTWERYTNALVATYREVLEERGRKA